MRTFILSMFIIGFCWIGLFFLFMHSWRHKFWPEDKIDAEENFIYEAPLYPYATPCKCGSCIVFSVPFC